MAELELRVDGAVARLELNRPDKRNALTLAMWGAVPGLVAQAQASRSVRLIVVRGRGGHFAAGADIAEFADAYRTPEAALANQETMQAAMRALENSTLPSLALIEGACVGGGCGLALACDMRWATASAKFAITPAKLGLAYGAADTRRLIQAVGASRAKDMLFTARGLDAETALNWGLIDRMVTANAIEPEIDALANMLIASARYSTAAAKRIASKVCAGADDNDEESRRLFAEAFTGADLAEGLRAFLEKRTPNFE